jgi:hypothetical protein
MKQQQQAAQEIANGMNQAAAGGAANAASKCHVF